MILRAISSLIATRDSLTFTITFPFRLENDRNGIACNEAQILQMLFGLRVSADLSDNVFFTGCCECKRHQILRPLSVCNSSCLIAIKAG